MTVPVRRCIALALMISVLLVAAAWSSEEINPWSKMEGFLQAQLAAKMKYLEKGSRRDLDLMAKNRVGVNDSDPAQQLVFLHFKGYPRLNQLLLLKRLGVKIYEDTWIPPMENHPTGFMIADMQVTRALDVAKQDFVVRMGSAEKKRFPHNNLATAGANCPSMWSQGLDGSGVVICIHDSGLDTTHADIPTLVAGKDYHMAPDSLDDTLEGAHEHGTHVTGSALGRGTLSSGTYKGAAYDADLVFLKIGGDTTSSAEEAAMIAANIASVDTYGVDIISVSYGGLNEFNDGSEEDCQAQDWVVQQGVVYLTSAGNSADDWMHVSETLGIKAADDTIQITVDVDSIRIPILMTWYDGADTSVHVDLELQLLDDSYSSVACSAYTQTHSPRGTESQYFESEIVLSGNYYAVITETPPKSRAAWDFHLYSVEWNAWFPNRDQNYTVVGGACADQAISVGAWVSRGSWADWCGDGWWFSQTQDDIASFSSRGPRIDGAGSQLPFITAGGSALASCMDHNFSYSDWETIDNDGINLDCSGPADYIIMQGTSMASPIAAGVCALLLEHNPNLTPQQVKNILIDNAITDLQTGAVPNDTWGYGKINAAIDLIAPARIDNLAITSVDWNKVTLGWTAPGDDGTSGTASQYDIRYSTSPPAKADTAAWWAGATQVTGEPVPQAYGNPESMEVTSLSPGTPYYFAIKALDEHYNASDISDIVMDVTLAVTLSSFEATPVSEGILVEWVAESERDNRGYHLSRSLVEEGPFDFLVFLDGAGNSSGSQNYRFVDEGVQDGLTYWYLLESEDISGQRSSFGPIQVTAEKILLPKEFALSQNYPNPFNPITRIKYQLAGDVPVKLLIYNVRGQQVATLVDRDQPAGYYEIEWRGTDGRDQELASGVYFYRLQAGERVFIRKMVLLK